MTDTKKENKINFLNEEGMTSLLSTKLDGIKVSSKCKVKGGKQAAKKGGMSVATVIEDVDVEFNFNGTTLLEAIRFACGGSSFMVAAQSQMRRKTKEQVKGIKQVFHMSDLFNPPKRAFVALTATEKKLAGLEVMFADGDCDKDMYEMLKVKYTKAIEAEKAAK